MTKMDWSKVRARHRSDTVYANERALTRAADRLLQRHPEPKRESRQAPPPQPRPVPEWQVIGAACPWNPNPGKRLVFHNGELVSAA